MGRPVSHTHCMGNHRDSALSERDMRCKPSELAMGAGPYADDRFGYGGARGHWTQIRCNTIMKDTRTYVPSSQATLAIRAGKAIILLMMRRHMALQVFPASIIRPAVGVRTVE